MLRKIVTGMALVAISSSTLLADFSYQQKSTITGGAIASMMKIAGAFSKQAREPIETTVAIKGDRMVHRGQYRSTIIDLASQTITEVDLQKKTYTVMTFDQMRQMMDQMAQRMHQRQPDSGAEMNFKVSANATGNTKHIGDFDTKEMVVKMEMQATDQQSGQQGSMVITTDLWLAPSIAGYGEIRDFYRRMAEKLNWTPGGAFMGRPDVAKGMAEVYKETSKLDGVPVYQTVVMGAQGQPGQSGDASGAQQPAQPPADQQGTSDQQNQQKPSVGSALGGALGGRFGLGRKKSDSQQSSAGSQQSGNGSLMEMTTELSAFSAGAVDESLFSIPAGFKKVEPKNLQ
jgi:hypothetical protein